MKSLLIGYDLNKNGQNYTDLIKEIKEIANGWWKHLDSTFIINTDLSPREVRDILKQHLDSNDELLVCTLTGQAAWTGFNDRGSNWLNENLKSGCTVY